MAGWATPTHMVLSNWRCWDGSPEYSRKMHWMLSCKESAVSCPLSFCRVKWTWCQVTAYWILWVSWSGGAQDCFWWPSVWNGCIPRPQGMSLFKFNRSEGKNFSEYTWHFRLPPVGGVLWTSSSFEFPLFLLSPALGVFGHSLLKIWWVCNDISLWLFSFGGLCWVFVPACRLSQVAENWGYSLIVVWGLLIKWLCLLQSTGFRAVGFSCCVTKA